jgi:hypothetical protein
VTPAVADATRQLEDLRDRLLSDQRYYAENCLHIVNTEEQQVLLRAKPAQARYAAIIARQRAEGKPVRVIVLKARKEGISTWTQGELIHRVTTRQNHKALVVAHDGDTAKEIFEIGQTMYQQLPDEVIAGFHLKPEVVSTRKGQEIKFGEPSPKRRMEGHTGLNSSYYVDTANEYEAGRGFTYHSLHISELAFYKSAEKKLKALLNAVPDTPNTLIVIESTADGYNLFRRYWVAAISGNNEFVPLFIPWWEEPDYRRPFANAEDRERFIAEIGTGEYGDDEPALVEAGCSPEQLQWRRWAIQNKCHGDLRTFWQEYPATWEEAFLSAGRQVFSPAKTAKVLERTEKSDPTAARGIVKAANYSERNYMGRTVKIPENPLWVPESQIESVATPTWKVWENPDPGEPAHPEANKPERAPGQYVMVVDSNSGRETASEGTDYMAIELIDQRTGMQVAEYHARGIDADIVTEQAYLMALLYSPVWNPWLAVETTGGYGLSIVNKLWRIYRYGGLYFRRPAEHRGEKQEDRLGWSMDMKTKPLVVDHMKELLRLEKDGVRSKGLAGEFQTFVRDDKGRMGAEEDYFDDRLDAYMVAQYIAHEKPLRRKSNAAASGSRVKAPSLGVKPRGYRLR